MDIVLPHNTRIFTQVTYANLDPTRQPYNWELAHAALNASETGLMTIDEIVEATVRVVPARFMEDLDRKMKSCRAAMANNMSISPDFYKAVRHKNESSYRWALTGSVEGVPRPDKRVKRRETTPANSRSTTSSPMGKRSKGKGKKVRSLRGIHHQPEDDIPSPVPEENDHEIYDEVMEEAAANSETDEEGTTVPYDPAEYFEEGDDIFETALLDGQDGYIIIAGAVLEMPHETQDSIDRRHEALLAAIEAVGLVRYRAQPTRGY